MIHFILKNLFPRTASQIWRAGYENGYEDGLIDAEGAIRRAIPTTDDPDFIGTFSVHYDESKVWVEFIRPPGDFHEQA